MVCVLLAISFISMLAISLHALYQHFRHVEHFTTGWGRLAALVVEFVVFLMFLGSGVLIMMSPQRRGDVQQGPPPPSAAWAAATGLAWAEV